MVLAGRFQRASKVLRECDKHALHDRFGLLDALAGFAVGVAVPGDEVLQGELVDPVAVTESASRCPKVRSSWRRRLAGCR